MKNSSLFTCLLITGFALTSGCQRDSATAEKPDTQLDQAGHLDYTAFKALASEVAPVRSKRRVSVETFTKMASEPNTVILDTRSKRDYEDRHIKGAVHIDFADINEATLRETIPDPNTRVLIYCVNNFVSMREAEAAQLASPVSPTKTKLVAIPDEYKTVGKRVMTTPPATTSKKVPAGYDTGRVRKMVQSPRQPAAASTPPKTKTVTRQKLVAPARTRVVDTPAEYKTVEQQVEVSPGKFETRASRVMISPPEKRVEVIPAQYETITEVQAVEKAEEGVITPKKYETRESRVMVSPPSKRAETIPTRNETVNEQVLVKEAGRRLEVVAPRYEWVEETVPIAGTDETGTVRVRKMIEPASTRSVPVPAEYTTVTRKRAARPKPAEPAYDTSVALNVPTYITLADYGYNDVFELGPALSWHSPRLQFGGSSAVGSPTISAEMDQAVERSAAKTEHVDFEAFVSATEKNEGLWRQRLVNAEQFGQMAKEPNTLILDARSQASFDQKHFQNAVHLNFSEFSQKKLGEVIPNRSTRILLYCDTNLRDGNSSTESSARTALTLPTFIQLVTYGYPNVYVLGETVHESSPLLAIH